MAETAAHRPASSMEVLDIAAVTKAFFAPVESLRGVKNS